MTRSTFLTGLTATAAVACSAIACGGGHPSEAPAVTVVPPAVHAHAHTPPHGGTLVELGEEFAHLEFVFDQPSGRVTVFVLDGEAERAIRVSDASLGILLDAPPALANRPLELVAAASVLTGETVGGSAEFSLERHELSRVTELSGRVLSCYVRGQTFRDVTFHIPPTVTTRR